MNKKLIYRKYILIAFMNFFMILVMNISQALQYVWFSEVAKWTTPIIAKSKAIFT